MFSTHLYINNLDNFLENQRIPSLTTRVKRKLEFLYVLQKLENRGFCEGSVNIKDLSKYILSGFNDVYLDIDSIPQKRIKNIGDVENDMLLL